MLAAVTPAANAAATALREYALDDHTVPATMLSLPCLMLLPHIESGRRGRRIGAALRCPDSTESATAAAIRSDAGYFPCVLLSACLRRGVAARALAAECARQKRRLLAAYLATEL